MASQDRTTLDIIQSCVATLIACTWVTLHPPLPPPKSSPRDIMSLIFFEKPVAPFAAVIFPEVMLATAFDEWFQSILQLRMLRAWATDRK